MRGVMKINDSLIPHPFYWGGCEPCKKLLLLTLVTLVAVSCHVGAYGTQNFGGTGTLPFQLQGKDV